MFNDSENIKFSYKNSHLYNFIRLFEPSNILNKNVEFCYKHCNNHCDQPGRYHCETFIELKNNLKE